MGILTPKIKTLNVELIDLFFLLVILVLRGLICTFQK